MRWVGELPPGSWLEGRAAPAPPPGSSLERVTSASDGRIQDTGDNAADFIVQPVPSPQRAQALTPAATPTPTPVPTPAATAVASLVPTPVATATAWPAPVSVAAARAMANGTPVTIDATALTESAFGDGGGHLADGSGGIAVIVEDGVVRRRLRGWW